MSRDMTIVQLRNVEPTDKRDPFSSPHALSDVLRASSLFGGLADEVLDGIRREIGRVDLASGEVLFRAGDRGDSLYVVLHGRLRILVTNRDGRELVVREAGRGENVGELALLTGKRRSATVQAVRDTVLARLSRESFLRLVEKHPSMMLELTRMLASWLVQGNEPRLPSPNAVVSLAVLPYDRWLPATAFCDELARALSRFGRTAVVSAASADAALGWGAAQRSLGDPGHDRLANWLDAQERQHRFLVYQGDPEASNWSRCCVRQADRVLHLGSGHRPPATGGANGLLTPALQHTIARQELVLLRGSAMPSHTRDWLALRPFSRHHHIQLDRTADLERLARHLAGRAIGLVLGGGGARGFAHIGVIRALEEASVPIDRVGGASMGAVIAAQYAQGFDYAGMLAVNREHWIGVQPARDFTLPMIALLSGRKGTRMLERMFGDARIEDLPLDYYCTSTNLTRGEPMVHREGLLRDWIRASISIPGVAPPFVTESGELLVDGAVLNAVPADMMHHPDDGIVIAVDVSRRVEFSVSGPQQALPSPWRALWQSIRHAAVARKFPSIFAIMQRTAHLGAMQLAKGLRDRVHLYLAPSVGHWDLFDWSAIDAIAETGYRETRQTIDAWKAGFGDRGSGIASSSGRITAMMTTS
jgi:NTE family protein